MHPYPSHGDATRPVPFYRVGTLYDVFWDRTTIIYPGAGGGSDWCHSSFNPATGWICVPYGLVSSSYSNTREGRVNTSRPLGEYMAGGMAAVDPRTNRVVWRRDHGYSICHGNGILTTDGGVTFQGWPDGALHAFDDRNGEILWSFQTGAGVHTSLITHAIDGEQYIAVFAGGNRLPYQDIPLGDHLWVFGLGGTVAPAAAPTPPSKRRDIRRPATSSADANNTVTLGRIWNAERKQPGDEENLAAENAMAPQHLRIPVGTTVTFVNPADNKTAHAAVSFWEPEFDSGILLPRQSFTHTFNTIDDITVVTTIEGGAGVVNVKGATAGEYASTGKARLNDIEADLNFNGGFAEAILRVPSARFWSPRDPHLYPLTITLTDGQRAAA